MSRANRIKMRRIEHSRLISFIVCMIVVSFFFTIIFSNHNVIAEKALTYKYYTDVCVDRDETLWTIAEQYMSEEYGSIREYIKEVQDLNNIGLEVQYGQHIIVPYYSNVIK